MRAEIILDSHRLAEGVRREWESLKPEDTVYLLAVHSPDDRHLLTNGDSHESIARKSAIRYLRTADVVQLLDDSGRPIRDTSRPDANGFAPRQRLRRMIVNIDAAQFRLDSEHKERGEGNIYESFNLIVRRRGRENNFNKILNTIQGLVMVNVPMPAWLQEVFLGYGDPRGATYPHYTHQLQRVDFRDTFLDWRHLVESLPGKVSIRSCLSNDLRVLIAT